VAETPRRDLFRYLTVEETDDYLAILDLFTATLLADLSAADVAELLADRGITVDRDTAEVRCRQLLTWGNLVGSIRDARVTTVAEYLRSRSRYQVSKLGGRVHREARAVLEATEGAREVARELLGQIVDALDRVLVMVDSSDDDLDPVGLAGEVTAIFSNQRVFTESVRDFYAYLAGVLSRYDLGGEEYAQFKQLLLEYIDLIAADVNRHAPAVAGRIETLLGHLDRLLDTLATLPGLTAPDGTPVERAEGRDRQDWLGLAEWYGMRGGSSGPDQLRAAAGQALGQLITNAKRLLDTSGTGYSRRADLLRLAGWFNDTDDATAHRIYAAAFLGYPCRHLALGPEEDGSRATPGTSWWDADPVDVPVSLRERGDRTIRGRSSRVPDPTSDRAMIERDAQRESEYRRAVAAELIAAGRLHGARLSAAARDLLLERLSDMFARQEGRGADTDLGLVLIAEPGPPTVIAGDDGRLTVDGLQLWVRSIDTASAGPAAAPEAAELDETELDVRELDETELDVRELDETELDEVAG
jgi:uncharacterized protein (TIGR02677 family)